jgi:hypothetical protein
MSSFYRINPPAKDVAIRDRIAAIHWLIQALAKPYQFGKDVEVMLTIRACERRGIKTALLVTYEYRGKGRRRFAVALLCSGSGCGGEYR